MKILIISNNYKPELTGPGVYITDLAEYLSAKGEEITVVTSYPHYPHWRLYPGFRQRLFERSIDKGVRIIRCPIYIPKSPSTLKRMGYDLSFTLSSFWGGILRERFDLIYCVSPPLTIGLTAELLSRFKRCPFIFHIMDLIPDTAVALGMLRNKLILNILKLIEGHIYRASSGIVVISPGFEENLLRKGLKGKKKIALLPNWVDTSIIKPSTRMNGFREKYGIADDEFVVTYAGNMGNKQGLETLLQSAGLMTDGNCRKVRFLMVGEGARKAYLLEYSERCNLENVMFLPLQPPEVFPDLLAASDALAITQKKSVTDICIPSKLMTSCASGRPLLAAVNENSETAKFIGQAGCGIVVEPENPPALKTAVMKLLNTPELGIEMGKQGRLYVEKNFAREKILENYSRFIYEIVESNKQRTLSALG
ncbi:MAG: glycosyltransferase family 4 protein [candidate division Zixibacteria bacterium]|nr:glycosyltransferase family 4 protein [Candidatus Tariuqbacter arcticus]